MGGYTIAKQPVRHEALICQSMIPKAQRELDSGSPALQVLRRFVRSRVATWRLRVDIKNARVLARVFKSASSVHHANRPRGYSASRHSPCAAERQKRVLELQLRAFTPTTDAQQSLACDLKLKEDPENSSSSDCEERVSVESVVHKLFLQLEASKRSAEANDACILELEALVAALTCENHQLRHQLQNAAKSHQLTELLSSCNTVGEKQIEVHVSNQLEPE